MSGGCTGKRAYPTRLAARAKHPKMRAYFCPMGHGYHVTSSKRGGRRTGTQGR